MRTLASWSILLGLSLVGFADETKDPPAPGAAADAGAQAPSPEPPAFVMPDGERKKLEKLLADCFDPGRAGKAEALDRLEKHVAKPVGGHSLLEDVATVVDVCNRLRVPNMKLLRFKGKITPVDVKPNEHGFPGGIGTVKYHMYVPKNYDPATTWAPLLLCLPDNRTWDNGAEYVKQMWLDRAESVANRYVIIVPEPQSKGEAWTTEKSMARAMIAMRHACGNFEPASKGTCAAVDLRRVYVDGAEAAALVAARFAELFRGAILHGASGRTENGPDLARAGGLAGLPAYCVCDPKRTQHAAFGAKIQAANAASAVESAADADARLFGDAARIGEWLDKLDKAEHADAPRSLDFVVHDGSFQRFHWLNVLDFDPAAQPAAGIVAKSDRAANVVTLEPNGVDRFEVWLNDAIADLNRDVTIVVRVGGKDHTFWKGIVDRKLAVMLVELEDSNHPWRAYTSRFVVDVSALQAKKEG